MSDPTPARLTFSDQVRAAVDASGHTRYRICKAAKIAEAAMSRFMAGKGGLSMASLDRLADMLGLDVVTRGLGDGSKDGGA